MKSEGTQHILQWHKKRDTRFGQRVCTEIGTIRNLEKDDTVNYILIPNRFTDKDGKEKTGGWSIHPLPKDTPKEFDDIILKAVTNYDREY